MRMIVPHNAVMTARVNAVCDPAPTPVRVSSRTPGQVDGDFHTGKVVHDLLVHLNYLAGKQGLVQ